MPTKPPKQERFLLKDFTGGLNTRDDPTDIADNQTPDCQNMFPYEPPAIKKRLGYEVTGSSMANAPVLGLTQFKNEAGNEFLVASCSGSDYYLHSVSGWTSITGGYTSGRPVSYAMYNNLLSRANGAERVCRYSYTAASGWAVTTPTGVPSGASGAPIAQWLTIHKERVFAANDPATSYKSRVQFAAYADPTHWQVNNFVNVKPSDGQEATGIKAHNDILYVFKERAIHALQGGFASSPATGDVSADEYTVAGASDQIGSVGQRTIDHHENVLIFLSYGGVYTFDGSTLTLISDVIKPDLLDLDRDDLDASVGCVARGRYYLATRTGDVAYNDVVYVYDFNTQGWWKHTNMYFASLHYDAEADRLYGGDSRSAAPYGGYVYELDIGTSDPVLLYKQIATCEVAENWRSTLTAPIKVGAYVYGSSVTALETFEELVGRKQDFLVKFVAVTEAWPTTLCNDLIARGTTPLVTWEPFGYSLQNIIDGNADSYIDAAITAVKTITGTIWIRPMHEMNGNWYPWGYPNATYPESATNTPARYILAWKHIVNKFRIAGVGNVRWLWCPNHNGLPNWDSAQIPDYYPGSSYVDILGLDGYNLTSQNWRCAWEKLFDLTASSAYDIITALHTTADLYIVETSSKETTQSAGTKESWIRDLYNRGAYSGDYPRLKGIGWFHQTTTDYKVDSSASALAAFKHQMDLLSKHVTVVWSPTTDGYINNDENIDWIGARGNASGTSYSVVNEHIHARSFKTGAGKFSCGRAFQPFTISGVPADGTVSTATLYVALKDVTGSGEETHAVTTSLTGVASVADFALANWGSASAGSILSGAPTSGYTPLTINTAVLSVPISGAFYMGLRGDHDLDNVEPTGEHYNRFYSADGTQDDYKPFLEVQYTRSSDSTPTDDPADPHAGSYSQRVGTAALSITGVASDATVSTTWHRNNRNVTIDTDGNIYVAYADNNAKTRIQVHKYDSSGNLTDLGSPSSAQTTYVQQHPTLLLTASGDLLCCWDGRGNSHTSRHVFFSKYTAGAWTTAVNIDTITMGSPAYLHCDMAIGGETSYYILFSYWTATNYHHVKVYYTLDSGATWAQYGSSSWYKGTATPTSIGWPQICYTWAGFAYLWQWGKSPYKLAFASGAAGITFDDGKWPSNVACFGMSSDRGSENVRVAYADSVGKVYERWVNAGNGAGSDWTQLSTLAGFAPTRIGYDASNGRRIFASDGDTLAWCYYNTSKAAWSDWYTIDTPGVAYLGVASDAYNGGTNNAPTVAYGYSSSAIRAYRINLLSTSSTAELVGALDLSQFATGASTTADVVSVAVRAQYADGFESFELRLMVDDGNYYTYTWDTGSMPSSDGTWTHFAVAKSGFTTVGSPTWATVAKIQVIVTTSLGNFWWDDIRMDSSADAAIDAYWKSKTLDFDEPEVVKRYKKGFLTFTTEDTPSEFIVEYELDEIGTTTSADLEPYASDSRTLTNRRLRLAGRGKLINLKLSNAESGRNMELHDVALYWKKKKAKELYIPE